MTSDRNKGKIDVPKDIKEHLEMAKNVQVRAIIVLEDKVRLYLKDYEESVARKSDWMAPAGILLTLAITLVTCKFEDIYLISGVGIQGFFLCLLLVSGCWLAKSIKDASASQAKTDIETLLSKMKGDFDQPPPVTIANVDED